MEWVAISANAIPKATSDIDGLMSKEDKIILDNLSGSSVTGVKGAAETDYRQGNINLTPENIGLGNVPNVATNDQTPTFTQAPARLSLVSGEKISTLFGKIMKWFSDLKTVSFTGSYNDLTNKPSIPAAVAVKGNAESSYRTGNVNLTPANIGALGLNGGTLNGTLYASRFAHKSNLAYNDARSSVSYVEPLSIYDKNNTRVGYVSTRYNAANGVDLWLGADHGGIYLNGSQAITASNISSQVVNQAYHLYSPTSAEIKNDTASCCLYENIFRPFVTSNDKINLGSPSARWKQIYSASTAISTSDGNMKKNIQPLTEQYEKFFLLLQPVSFLFKNGNSGRTHIGFISQDVEAAMKQAGLTDLDFAGFCKDILVQDSTDDNGNITGETAVLDDDGNPVYIYSLRYEEFIGLITFTVQKLWSEIEQLKKDMIYRTKERDDEFKNNTKDRT